MNNQEFLDIVAQFFMVLKKRCAGDRRSHRSGLKCGPETVKVDLQKAENYIHSAMTGSWIDRHFIDGSGKPR